MIWLGVGRKGFEQNPKDAGLLTDVEQVADPEISKEIDQTTAPTRPEVERPPQSGKKPRQGGLNKLLAAALLILAGLLGFAIYKWQTTDARLATLKKDLSLMPYQPTAAEIDSLAGIWLCYTGSPQARTSDPHRYHMVVRNVLDVKYKNGYFTFTRYGASFNHNGYMQFESPWLVSIHSYVNNKRDSIESPRHSLMRLNMGKPYISVISASWNFDAGTRNDVIGIREVYVKQGKGGNVEEVLNTIENASCHCKIIRWAKDENHSADFYLKNELLDTISEGGLKSLLNEKSILLRTPVEGLVLTDSASSIIPGH